MEGTIFWFDSAVAEHGENKDISYIPSSFLDLVPHIPGFFIGIVSACGSYGNDIIWEHDNI